MGDTDKREMANAIRALSMDAVEAATCGHPGAPMGLADVATVLFTEHLKFDASAPDWPDRDRFVLSNGHASMLLYSLLYLTGYSDMTLDEIRNFRQLGSKTPGHPEYGHSGGVETTTGPLGQGLANAVGMALAERMLAARYGDDLVDHHTYVFAGDGCLMEGVSHEAISLAGHLRLNKLIVLFDDNDITIDGPTSLSVSDDQGARFAASGWATDSVDGHDAAAVSAAIARAKTNDRPTMIACKTTIGYGAPSKAGTASAHGAKLGDEEIAATREALGWPYPPFEVPDNILQAWRAAGVRGRDTRDAWEGRLGAADGATRSSFNRQVSGELPPGLGDAVATLKAGLADEKPGWATRKASQEVLNVLAEAVPELIGGSADLTGSNNTKAAGMVAVTADDFSGRYLQFGVREHGMAAAMNGIALHGGFRPYGGTFLTFSDYARPSMRLAAMMGIKVVFVMSHDSIGLGEDGPTHQPVEHLAALRAIPGLLVMRPGDAMETAECWDAALRAEQPSVVVLTRQGLPAFRHANDDENLCARGGYLVTDPATRDVTLLATGSEVGVALGAADLLAQDGIKAAVVSLPCWELFDAGDDDYRATVLGSAPRVAVEAAVGFGWERYLDNPGAFVGMPGFGASAPAAELFEHFGITPAKVADAARRTLNN